MEKYRNDKRQTKTAVINGVELTKRYLESISRDEREALIEPTFNYFRELGFVFPDNLDKVFDEYRRLVGVEIDTSTNDVFNNSSLATYICKYFCHSFYYTTEIGKNGKRKNNMIELYNDDDILRSIIKNRFGLNWSDGENWAFTMTPRMIIQGFRSMRLVNMVSMFKPDIAKYLCLRYSNEGDIIYDYSAGFGGRMLGTNSCKRKYIGVDPLTSEELRSMIEYLKLKDCTIYNSCSEEFNLGNNIIDLCYSSPPYYNLEVYSSDERQAYNKGAEYFYNIYWANTLSNIKKMLKPNKVFCLNVKDQPMMVKMADEMFRRVDEVRLRTVRSHLNKKGKNNAIKYESIYVYINEK